MTYIILGGDFNAVLDSNLDRSIQSEYNKNSKNVILEKMENLNLNDVWRIKNPELRQFSWHQIRLGVLRWSRIDYFLSSAEMNNWVTDCQIKPGLLTNHSLIQIQLQMTNTARGPGIWKMNDLLMENPTFCKQMQERLVLVQEQYNHLDPIRLWEMLKFEIRTLSREFSKGKSHKDRDR